MTIVEVITKHEVMVAKGSDPTEWQRFTFHDGTIITEMFNDWFVIEAPDPIWHMEVQKLMEEGDDDGPNPYWLAIEAYLAMKDAMRYFD